MQSSGGDESIEYHSKFTWPHRDISQQIPCEQKINVWQKSAQACARVCLATRPRSWSAARALVGLTKSRPRACEKPRVQTEPHGRGSALHPPSPASSQHVQQQATSSQQPAASVPSPVTRRRQPASHRRLPPAPDPSSPARGHRRRRQRRRACGRRARRRRAAGG